MIGHGHEEKEQDRHLSEEVCADTSRQNDTIGQFNDAVGEPFPAAMSARPQRVKQQNKKYDPEIYDLSTVSCRKRSRKSVRRAT